MNDTQARGEIMNRVGQRTYNEVKDDITEPLWVLAFLKITDDIEKAIEWQTQRRRRLNSHE